MVIAPGEKMPNFAAQAERLVAEGVTGRALRKALTALGAPRNLAYELSLSADSEAES